MKRENKQLKRLSLASTAPPALPEEEPPEEDPDPAQRYGQQLKGGRAGGSWLSPARGGKAWGKAPAPARLPRPGVP